MKTSRNVIVKIVIIILIIVIMVNVVTIKPIRLSTKGVEEVHVGVGISTMELHFDGFAIVSEQSDIKDVVKILNGIRAYRWGEYSVYDLEGDSPTVMISIYDRGGEEIDSIYFYQNILSYGDKFYKVNMSEYDGLMEICKKYGDYY